jgi:hypothetical protein
MGTRNFTDTNSRASLAAMPVSPEDFWLPRRNKLLSEKSDDEVRPISVDCRPVMSSVDVMAINRIPSEVREVDQLSVRADFSLVEPYPSVFTIEIKERTSPTLSVSREMAY